MTVESQIPPEPSPAVPPPPAGRTRGCWILAGMLLVLGMLAIYFAYRIAQRVIDAPSNLLAAATEKEEEQLDLSAVVTEVRALARLETARMRVVHMSTIRQSYKLIPDAIAGDQLTLIAEGEVIAGIDLAEITADDVWREDDALVIRLPPPRILVSRIDNRKTRVLNRDTGVLRRGDIHLESRAREAAERGIRNEALRGGVLEVAGKNAEERLAKFLHTLGAETVRFADSSRGVSAPEAEH
jgi:hypothetical protein